MKRTLKGALVLGAVAIFAIWPVLYVLAAMRRG